MDEIPTPHTSYPADLSPLQQRLAALEAALAQEQHARQQAEQAWRASERRFQAVLAQQHQLAGLLSPEGVLLEANDTALQLSGLQRAEVLGRPFWETGWWRHDADLQQRLRSAITEAAHGHLVQFEATHPRPDGSLAMVDFSLRPITDDTGAVIFLVPESQDISALKQAEASLALREAHYRELADAVPGIVWIGGPHGATTYVNRYWCAYTGQTLAQALGEGWSSMIHPEDAVRCLPVWQQAVAQGTPYNGEARYRQASGAYRWFLEQALPVHDAHGRIVQWIGIAMDIEDQKRTAAALASRIQRLDALRTGLTEITSELDLPTLLQLIIRRATELVGATHGVVYGWDDTAQVLVPQGWTDPPLVPWLPELRLRLGEGISGQAAHQRRRLLTNDYRHAPYAYPRFLLHGVNAAVAEPLLYRDRLLGVMTLSHTAGEQFDLHEDGDICTLFAVQAAVALQHAQLFAATQEERTRLQAIVDTAVDATLIIDEHGLVTMCNPAVASLFGYTPAEVLGHNVSLLMPCPDREAHDDYLARYLRTGERRIIGIGREVVGRHKNGTQIPVRLAVSEIHQGSRRLFVGMLHDLTTYKQAEAVLRQDRNELEVRVQERTAALQEANADIRRFATIVSHDLRAPLINIKGFAGELQEACGVLTQALSTVLTHLEAPQRVAVTQALETDIPAALGFIDTSASRMDRLIQAILRLARLGRQPLQLEALDPAEIVQDTLRTLAHQLVQQQVQVQVEPLPVIQADRMALMQIFGNLLANAVAYLEPHRPGQLKIWAEVQREAVAFHVQDNGRGIAAADLERIFEPFQRVGRCDVPGEGVGLTYVRRLVQRHAGEITCQSELGVGTTFNFTIASDQRIGIAQGG